jgi:orotidine-5'-phosphate decarboxylase
MADSPVFIAIDTPDAGRALALARTVAPHAGGLKLGLEFFAAHGPGGVRDIAEQSGLPLFLDLKLHDIPNTVAGAVAALAPLAPAILTVHAAGGHGMLRAAKTAAPPGCRVVAVTVLTSLTARDLEEMGLGATPEALALSLARTAREAGLDGIVCSPFEAAAVRRQWSDACIVTPGVRPEGSALGDQKRAATPREALRAGADILVVGRPVTAAPDPAAAAAALLA